MSSPDNDFTVLITGDNGAGKLRLCQMWQEDQEIDCWDRVPMKWDFIIKTRLPRSELRLGALGQQPGFALRERKANENPPATFSDVRDLWEKWDSTSMPENGRQSNPIPQKGKFDTASSGIKRFLVPDGPHIKHDSSRENSNIDMGTVRITFSVDSSQANPYMSHLGDIALGISSVVGLCFSVEDLTSLDRIPHRWLPQILFCAPNAPIVLIATKTDLRNQPREESDYRTQKSYITTEEGWRLAKQIGAVRYIETSARWRSNVREVFMVLAAVVGEVARSNLPS